jgi:hypothetical protein
LLESGEEAGIQTQRWAWMNSRIREIKHFSSYAAFLAQIEADGYTDLLKGDKERAEVSVPLYYAYWKGNSGRIEYGEVMR